MMKRKELDRIWEAIGELQERLDKKKSDKNGK